MNLIKIITMLLITTLLLQGANMHDIKTVWDEIESYWKMHDKKLVLNDGDTQSDIDEFEKKYGLALPQELIYSLKRNYQNSRRGRKNENSFFLYPWFGSDIGIDLLSIVEINEGIIYYKKSSNLDLVQLPHISIVYLGKIISYDNLNEWHDKWIPIVWNHDIPVILFIDLDKSSKNYQKVIGFYQTYIDGVGDHFRFALIAKNYLAFMVELKDMFLAYQKENNHKMEETKAGYGFEFYYYEKKFKLPKGFWTDEYREEQIKKMGLK